MVLQKQLEDMGLLDKAEKADVDMRFLLANERTLLAWIRTSLALQAGGIAVVHFDNHVNRWLAISIVALGALTALAGYSRYRAADSAIRKATIAKPGVGPILITAAVIIIGIAATIIYL